MSMPDLKRQINIPKPLAFYPFSNTCSFQGLLNTNSEMKKKTVNYYYFLLSKMGLRTKSEALHLSFIISLYFFLVLLT